MKMFLNCSTSLRFLCANLLLFFSMASFGQHNIDNGESWISLLWNPGPRYSAGLTWANSGTASNQNCSYWGSDLSQAASVGNPSGLYNGISCIDGFVPAASNGAGPSYFVDTRVGWLSSDLNTYPGWSIWTLSGGNGTPIERQFINNAAVVPNPCELREIGHVSQRWPLSPEVSSFKPNGDGSAARLGDYASVIGSYTAKVNHGPTTPACTGYPSAYITSDFRVTYVDANQNVITTALLGVISYGVSNINLDGSPSNGAVVYWSDATPFSDTSNELVYRQLLHGDVLSSLNLTGVTSIPALNGAYQTVRIDFKKLISALSPPPYGYTINDAIISGFDVYSSVRGADLSFTLTNVDVRGYTYCGTCQ